MDHLGTWSDMLPLVEFTYNNNYHSNIGMAPYEAFMVGDATLLYVGSRIGSQWYLNQNIYSRLLRKRRQYKIECEQLRVDRNHTCKTREN